MFIIIILIFIRLFAKCGNILYKVYILYSTIGIYHIIPKTEDYF